MSPEVTTAYEKLTEKLEIYKLSTTLAKEALVEANKLIPLVQAVAPNIDSIEVTAHASDWSILDRVDGGASLDITITNGESWTDVVDLLNALEDLAGFSVDDWSTTDDAASFARTYFQRRVIRDAEGCRSAIDVRVTLALREGNSGGCRRIYVGKIKDVHTIERDEYKLVCGDTTVQGQSQPN